MEATNTEKILKEWEHTENLFRQICHNGNWSALDIDLLRRQLITLYEQVLTYSPEASMHNNVPSGGESMHKPEKPVEIKAGEPAGTVPPAPAVPVNDRQEVEFISEKEEDVQAPLPGSVKTSIKQPEIVADKFTEQRKYINEKLAETMQKGRKDIASSMQSKPIDDIESAIGLNDKFLFIKELFSGNAQRYKETIDALNDAPDFNAAYNLVTSMFDWNMEDPVVLKLLDLVRRRHIIRS